MVLLSRLHFACLDVIAFTSDYLEELASFSSHFPENKLLMVIVSIIEELIFFIAALIIKHLQEQVLQLRGTHWVNDYFDNYMRGRLLFHLCYG